ncbi:hypothetical protein H072_8206 [Dactylellina haptotyla CBS 200.50]|uniref:SYO1-like TPR repeats domain-containing protein n=1 Tax=Dactylellina haptotyla (strain CBS 200.50) TaxID=1284197 RepID=S8A5H5_DACHA|nr:hypothetical protein H072_8206 [Dactylellina haptotyla CBS 200.50]
MVDPTATKKRKKQSEPRAGKKSSANAFFLWSNPQSHPSTNSAENEILRDQKITPIIAGIQSQSPAERVQHLNAASSIVEDPLCRKLLLREHVVRVVMEHSLLDGAQEVVTAGWGFLNKLVSYEGYDVAVHLYRKGILDLVGGIIDNIETTIAKLAGDSRAIPEAAQTLLWDCAYNVVSLLTGLNETTQDVLEEISNQKFLSFASKLLGLNGDIYEKVQTAAAVFLDRVTDRNESAYAVLSQDAGLINQLQTCYTAKTGISLLQVTASCSTLHNLITQSNASNDEFSDEYHIADAALTKPLTAVISTVLSKQAPSQEDQKALFVSLETLEDIADQAVETFGQHTPSGANGLNGKVDEMEEDENEGDDEEDAMEEDELEPEEEGAEEEEEDVSDEEFPDELAADLEMVTGDEGTSARASKKKPLSSPELEYLVANTVPTILPIATSSPSSEPQRRLKLAAITLLSSVAGACAALTSTSGKSKFTLTIALLDAYLPMTHTLWDNLVTPILLSNSADITLAEKITNLSVHITAFTQSVSVANNQHKSFLALYNATESIPLKVLCIKVLSNLARCQGTDRVNINKEIGTFLISTVNRLPYLGDTVNPQELPAPEVIIECLDCIFDVYADQDFDYDQEVFVNLGFLKYLKSFVGRVRVMAKKIDKRKQLELRDSADAALLNLNAFIKYKTEERED